MNRNFNKGGSAPLSPPRNHPLYGVGSTKMEYGNNLLNEVQRCSLAILD